MNPSHSNDCEVDHTRYKSSSQNGKLSIQRRFSVDFIHLFFYSYSAHILLYEKCV